MRDSRAVWHKVVHYAIVYRDLWLRTGHTYKGHSYIIDDLYLQEKYLRISTRTKVRPSALLSAVRSVKGSCCSLVYIFVQQKIAQSDLKIWTFHFKYHWWQSKYHFMAPHFLAKLRKDYCLANVWRKTTTILHVLWQPIENTSWCSTNWQKMECQYIYLYFG